MLKEAYLFKKAGERIKCLACARGCLLGEGQIGFCGVRGVKGGKLYLLNYGIVEALHMDPIEKKPLVHFYPGSKVLSMGTTGCSWACAYCQNFDLSQRKRIEGIEMMPDEIINLAKRYGADGLAYTYNEPSIFAEFAHDVGVEGRKAGLFNVFVSNGYFTDEEIDYFTEFLDAITVDFKGNGNRNFLRKYAAVPDPEPIFNSLKELRRKGVHVEITDLVVPEVGDSLDDARRLSRWIVDNLGDDTPIHFLRFHPDYKMLWLPETPLSTLEAHYRVARDEGLKFVYLGNVPGHPYEHTYCPNCGAPVIKRYGFEIIEYNLDDENRCKFCGYRLPIKGKPKKEPLYRRFFPVEF
ncbi:MAG: AmmeMemoRadiSam system radical SAM enzyme [Nitrososphaeria archaeon]